MHRKILAAGVLAIIACAMVAQASTPPADSAEQLLLKAQLQFQKKQFTDARKSLWQAYQMRTTLSASHKRMLQQRLAEVDDAIERNILAAAATRPVVAPVAVVTPPAPAPKPVAPAPKPVVLAAAPKPWPAASKVAVKPVPVKAAPVKVAPKVVAVKAVPVKTAPVKVAPKVVPVPAPALTATQAQSIKAQELVAKGKSALAKNDFASAEGFFQAALKVNPQNVQARKGMNAVTIGLARSGETSMLTKYIQQKKVAAQKVRHEYDLSMKKSYELMAPEVGSKTLTDASFRDAVSESNAARATIQNAQSLFTAVEYRRFLNEVDRHLKRVAAKKDDWNLFNVRQQKIQVGKMQADLAQRTLRSRQTKIKELTSQALSLRADRKYVETLQVVEEILKLDPDNDWAQDNAYSLRNFIILQANKRNKDQLNENVALAHADIKRAEIPWYQELRYPKNWKELTKIREAYGADEASESEENRITRTKLERKISAEPLVDVEFEAAIEYVRENMGVNIYVNWALLEQEKDDIRNQKVTVQLTNVKAETILKKILEEGGGGDLELGYVLEDGVVNISTVERLNERTINRTYDIRDLMARVPNFAGPRIDLEAIGENVDQGSTSGTGSSSGGSSGGSSSLFEDNNNSNVGQPDEQITKQEMAENIMKLIMETVDRDSWVLNGGTATCSELSGTLVIGQTAKNHREVRTLISSLRENRTIQVSIEARFIEVKTGFLNQIGVDLDVYFNIGSGIQGQAAGLGTPYFDPAGSGTALATPPIAGATPWAGAGVPTHNSNMSPITVGQTSSDWVWSGLAGRQTAVPGGIGSTITNAALTIAGTFLDDIQVDFLIRATQAHDSTRILTAPRITLFNGQRSYVSVATQQAYIAGLEPVVANNVVGFRPLVRYAPNGTMLDVDATVSHDRRYVTLTLRPQVVTLNLSAGAGQIGGIDYSGGVGLPNITLQDVQTTVSVPDGGTLLLGGLRLSQEVEREMGVPVVSKLPILNRMFTNKGKLRDESTLLILVKPKILINEEFSRNPRNHVATETVPTGFSR